MRTAVLLLASAAALSFSGCKAVYVATMIKGSHIEREYKERGQPINKGRLADGSGNYYLWYSEVDRYRDVHVGSRTETARHFPGTETTHYYQRQYYTDSYCHLFITDRNNIITKVRRSLQCNRWQEYL